MYYNILLNVAGYKVFVLSTINVDELTRELKS